MMIPSHFLSSPPHTHPSSKPSCFLFMQLQNQNGRALVVLPSISDGKTLTSLRGRVAKNIDHVDERTNMMAASSFIFPPNQNKDHYNATHQAVRRKMQDFQTWIQLGADINGEAAGDKSGISVSLSSNGTVLAVGGIANVGTPPSSDPGHVRVYQYANNTWTRLGGDIDGEAADDYSGTSVSLSSDGSILAVLALYNDGKGSNSGHVRVYKYANSMWTQLGADIDGVSTCDYSRSSVSLSSNGTVLAVGAPGRDCNGGNRGQVWVYQFATNGSWTKLGDALYSEAADDLFGSSVTLSSDGSVLAVGAKSNDGTSLSSNRGHVQVYQYANNTWTRLGGDIDGEAANDLSGFSVSLSSNGTVLAVGAQDKDASSGGHVRVYKYASSQWTQLGSGIDEEAAGDYSGTSVSLSSDGTVLAVEAQKIDGNDLDSGHVRVYKYANSTWIKFVPDIDGEADDAYSGTSISLSSDGTVLAVVGAPNNDGNGSTSGHVRVFSIQVSLAQFY